MTAYRLLAFIVSAWALLFYMPCYAIGPNTVHHDPNETDLASTPAEPQTTPAIRSQRPVSLAVSLLGKTPLAGANLDFNLFPYLGVGVGYGYFTLGFVSASFIPLYVEVYPLKSNFSPFFEAGADFVTVKFEGTSVLLNSTFSGTQVILGGGLEYRFDFGLLLRAEVIRFMNASVWAPGLNIGYSFEVK